MDGLMIQLAYILSTHPDDDFIINYKNVKFITGMSNKSWEDDFKEKVPSCFNKDNIYHHGQLDNCSLTDLKNGLIIIDEIDSGDKEGQRLHTRLRDSGITDINLLKKNNTRLIVVSATMLTQLKELFNWGNLHKNVQMEIPDNYISQYDFLQKGIIQQYYPIISLEKAKEWIKNDIIENYKTDYRVHIIRLNETIKTFLRIACNNINTEYKNNNPSHKNDIVFFVPHDSDDRIPEDTVKKYFKSDLIQHIILGIKGFFRRANLIPNSWKLKIGAVHEFYTKETNISVQIQGLPGRMTGYWKDIIEKGHKTGPIRTSIKAIENYEKIIEDPLNNNIKLNIIDKSFVKTKNWNIKTIEQIKRKFDKKFKGYQLILYDNITDTQIKEWCEHNNLPIFNCINTIEKLDKNSFIELNIKYEVKIIYKKISNSDLESYDNLKSYINLNFTNNPDISHIAEPIKKWFTERKDHKDRILHDNKWIDRILGPWIPRHINDYKNNITKNFILNKQMHLWNLAYDDNKNLNICLRYTTSNKLLPTESDDYINHVPYKVEDNAVTYSKIKSDINIEKLPDNYYWKSLDGYLYVYKKDHSQTIYFSNIKLDDQDQLEETNINTTG
jgi:hypothetical protein